MGVEEVVTHHIWNVEGRMKFRVSMRLFKKNFLGLLDAHAGNKAQDCQAIWEILLTSFCYVFALNEA